MVLLADLLRPLLPRSSIAYSVCHLISTTSALLVYSGCLSEQSQLELNVRFESCLHLLKFLKGKARLN